MNSLRIKHHGIANVQGYVMTKLDPPKNGPPEQIFQKYLDPPEQIFQERPDI